ncbi:MAG TPA: STAS domain-containing protein [Actinomycetes bacterium]|jgi:anti-anti-sigma factor|nr:STAS domain-containing protein [Actinomycetes bacterium]
MDLALSTSALDDPTGDGPSSPTRALVTVSGEVDLETAPELGDHALAALKDVSVHLVLDLRGVTFMDSTGLKVLLATAHRADLAGGSVVLVAPNRAVNRILTLTGLDKTFVLADDLASLPPVTTASDADLSGDAAPTP